MQYYVQRQGCLLNKALCAVVTSLYCRVLPDESPADDTDADLLLPFLQSAGSLILGLLQSQHHNKAEPHFNADVLQQRQSECLTLEK